MKIQLSERDMMRILTAAVREIKAAQKNEQVAACPKKGIKHEQINTKKATEEVCPGSDSSDPDRYDRRCVTGQSLDRISHSDIRADQ